MAEAGTGDAGEGVEEQLRTDWSERPGESIQSAFARFRKRKIAARRGLSSGGGRDDSIAPPAGGRSAEYKAALRRDFVERALSYCGVPYAQRYHAPGSTEYNSPLFLDCCALVRQAVTDLQARFGFRLGRWNQAYQADTLPVEVSLEEMKPGDLIFYSATYYDERKRPQKHGMVHVEVFLGGESGEETVASRWATGCVQRFDSFRFESKLYHSVTHSFRSIDTWLDGVCRSWCAEHAWQASADWKPGKHSIFSAAAMEEDDVADDDDDDSSAFALDGIDVAPLSPPEADEAALAAAAAAAEAEAALAAQPSVSIVRGNGSRLLTSIATRLQLRVLDAPPPSPAAAHVAWLQRRRQALPLLRRASKCAQLFVNFVHGSQALTTIAGLEETLRSLSPAWWPECHRLDVPSSFFALWKAYYREEGSDEAGEGAEAPVQWLLKPLAGRKIQLLTSLDDVFSGRAMGDDYASAAATAAAAADEAVDAAAAESKEEKCSEGAAEEEATKKAKLRASGQHLLGRRDGPPFLLQRYVAVPMLCHACKFDLRAFLLIVAAADSSWQCYLHTGYARKALSEWRAGGADDRFVHLTNAATQRKHSDYAARGDSSLLLPAALEAALRADGAIRCEEEQHWLRATLWPQMEDIARTVFAAAQPSLAHVEGSFQLVSMDFLLDAEEKLWLTEVNSGPSLATKLPAMAEVVPQLLAACLTTVLKGEDAPCLQRLV